MGKQIEEAQENGHIPEEDLTCPTCGATTTKNGKPFTENGLRMHQLTCGKPRTRKQKQHQPLDQPEIVEEEEDLLLSTPPSPMREDVRFPDESDKLYDVLRKVKCSKIPAVVEICQLKGFTTSRLYDALKTCGAGYSVIRPCIEIWSRYRGEDLPERAAIELGLHDEEEEYENRRQYGRRGRRNTFFDDEEDDQNRKFDLGIKIGKIDEKLNHLSQGGRAGEDPYLRQQLETLRKELQASEAKRTEEKFQAMQNKIEELAKSRNSDVASLTELVRDLGKSWINMIGAMSGAPVQPPKRERLFEGESTVADLVPAEMRE